MTRLAGRAAVTRVAVPLAIAMTLVLATDALGLSWLSDTALTKSGAGYAYPGGLAVSSTTVAHAIYEQKAWAHSS